MRERERAGGARTRASGSPRRRLRPLTGRSNAAVAPLGERRDALGGVVAALQHRDRVDRVLITVPGARGRGTPSPRRARAGARAAICAASRSARVEVLARRHHLVHEPGRACLARVEDGSGQDHVLQGVQPDVRAGRGRARAQARGRRPSPAGRTAPSRRPRRGRRRASARTRRRARGRARRRSSAWRIPRRPGTTSSASRTYARRSSAPASSAKPTMSPPTEKHGPVPCRTMTRTFSSSSAARSASASSAEEPARHRVQLVGAVQCEPGDGRLHVRAQHRANTTGEDPWEDVDHRQVSWL